MQINPSISSFIKHQFQIILSAESYPILLKNIKLKNIRKDGFKVDYLILDGDLRQYDERRKKLKDVGYCIDSQPDFNNPSIVYSICHYGGIWYFGILKTHDNTWTKHKQKPCSFSNSLDMNIAKTLVSIASQGMKDNTILDACCGVGTVLLEGCIAGFDIEGCDINQKAIKNAQRNLLHYGYKAPLYCSDIKDISKRYNGLIIDLPYNLYSYAEDTTALKIIQSSVALSNRIIIVSIEDISPIIKVAGLKTIDFCTVEKRGSSTFERSIWVCEKAFNNPL